MNNKLKPITEYTREELLKILEENPSNSEYLNINYTNDVNDFISTYGIKNGDHQIMLPVIYNLYKRWSKAPIHRNPFGVEMAKLFFGVKYGMGTAYRINKTKDFFLEKSTKKKLNKTKRKHWFKHFKKFMDKFELKSGRFYVKDVVLYNLYDKWTYKNNNHNPLSFRQFLKFCRLFFKNPAPKIIQGTIWFSMDSKIQEHLTPELINLMKQK
jgi:hypothetical protein